MSHGRSVTLKALPLFEKAKTEHWQVRSCINASTDTTTSNSSVILLRQARTFVPARRRQQAIPRCTAESRLFSVPVGQKSSTHSSKERFRFSAVIESTVSCKSKYAKELMTVCNGAHQCGKDVKERKLQQRCGHQRHLAIKVFQHTIDRMRLWSFVGHLTGFRHAVKLLCQHCVRDQEPTVHGHSWQRRLVLQMFAGIFCLARAATRHVRPFVFHVSLCVSGGRAFVSFPLASPPRLQSHLCPSVSFDLTLAHSAWAAQLLVERIAHSPFWFHSSPKLRLFLSSLSILPADFIHRTDPSTSFNRVFRPLSAHRQPSIPSRFSRRTHVQLFEYQRS